MIGLLQDVASLGWPGVALAVVNTVQVVALAWIAAEQAASRKERNKRSD